MYPTLVSNEWITFHDQLQITANMKPFTEKASKPLEIDDCIIIVTCLFVILFIEMRSSYGWFVRGRSEDLLNLGDSNTGLEEMHCYYGCTKEIFIQTYEV